MKNWLLPLVHPNEPDAITLQIINLDYSAPQQSVERTAAVLEYQLNEHVYPAWYGVKGNVHVKAIIFGQPIDYQAWWLVIAPNSEYARDRGFRDRTEHDLPIGHVYTNAEEELTGVALSREACSMLVDPFLNRWSFSISRDCWAMDIGAPVRGLTYQCRGIPVADFVYPAYYDPFPSPECDLDRPLDHTRNLDNRYQIGPNGYGVKIMGNGEVGVKLGSRLDQDFGRGMLGSRRERRRRGHRNWEDSVV